MNKPVHARLRLLPLLAALLLAPWAPAAAGATTLSTSRPAASADVQQYQALVDKLAGPEMEGRAAGTKGIELARDYLVEQFRAAGLKPAFGDSYLQEFQVPSGVQIDKQDLAVGDANAAADARELKGGVDFEAMGISANGAFAGEAVFVGYGIADKARKHDSFAASAPDALKGKVAVVLRYEPHDANGVGLWTGRKGSWSPAAGLSAKAALAARRGAVAVLIVNPAAYDTPRPDPVARTGGGPKSKVPVLHITRKAYLAILRAAGRDGEAGAKALRDKANVGQGAVVPLGVTVRGEVRLRSARAAVHNVAGILPGAGALADQCVVVGGHYDHVGYGYFGSRQRGGKPTIHPGADDNASGTGGVVLLGRWFARRDGEAAPAPAPAPRRSLLFIAFAAEEMGLVGSRHFLGHLSDAGLRREQIVAMLNLDMIGRLRPGSLSVWGVDTGERLRSLVEAAAKGSKLKLRLSGSGLAPSDLASFYRAKVPVLGLNTGMHGDVHAPTDTPDKINSAGAVEVLRLGEDLLQTLRTDPEPIAYSGPKPGERRAFLGIAFDADYEGPGCRIANVVLDGPAAKAGLRDGDVITGWDDKPVAGSSDLMVLIRHYAPGDSIKLKARRDDKPLDVTVKLGGR